MNKTKNLTIEETFKLAVKNHQEKNFNSAQNLYKKILETDPNHKYVLFNLGVLFIRLEEYQKAKNYFEEAIRVDPDYFDALINLGVVLKELKKYQEAKNCFGRVIAKNHDHPDAHFNLGNIYKELEEYQNAIDCYEKVIQINPNHKKAHNNLGLVFEELGDNQKAISCYEKLITIDPNFFNAFNNLAVIFKELGDNQKAIHCHERAIKIAPDNMGNLNNLGDLFIGLGEYLKALNCFDKVIQIDPNNQELLNSLTNLFQFIDINNIIDKNTPYLKKLFLFLFKNKYVYHKKITNNVISFLFKTENYNQTKAILNSKSLLLKNEIIQSLINEELLHLILQKSLLSSSFLEKLFTKIRCEILSTLDNSNKEFLKEYLNFIISLAEQCWLNEYVYSQNENETKNLIKLKNKIEKENEIDELEIAIMACYMPLNSSKIITNKLLNYKSENILFNDLIDVQIKEPLKELELKKSIKSFEEIKDSVSKKVREQYEEHPYPRWRYTNRLLPSNFLRWLYSEIKPNRIIYNNHFNNPNVLIAGCGTGNHTILATRYKNANITCVDLSLTSLAYAKRKTDELDLKNIEYLHADILQLKKLDQKFDIIECAGTLHHMKDPIAGLKVLLDVLEPHGFLKIGLYSEFARKSVIKAREFIKKNNFNNTADDIKICRQLLINEKEDPLLQGAVRSPDFYSTSSVRDLLFHVQEHRFTIPQISKILKDFNLEFLGFIIPDPFIKQNFGKLFPKDINKVFLDNWHEFEKKNPDTFYNMYQFWVRKI